jgi:hypothetical protein
MINSDRESISTEEFINALKEIADKDTVKENLIEMDLKDGLVDKTTKRPVGRPKKEKIEKPKRVKLTTEEKKIRANARRKERYETDEEFKKKCLETIRKCHEKNKEQKAKKEKEWYENNKEKRKDDYKERNKKSYEKIKDMKAVFDKLKTII